MKQRESPQMKVDEGEIWSAAWAQGGALPSAYRYGARTRAIHLC